MKRAFAAARSCTVPAVKFLVSLRIFAASARAFDDAVSFSFAFSATASAPRRGTAGALASFAIELSSRTSAVTRLRSNVEPGFQ